jgi:monofunctional chorismate mutase
MTKPTLDELRKEIEKVDNEIVSLVAKRLEIAESIGQFKIDHCMTIKAFDVEKKVNERYKELSEKFGIHSELSKDLSKLLIDHACRVQEQKRFNSVASDYKTTNSPGKAVIIGGAGNMGKWFYNFLNSFGMFCKRS